jgi:ubiquinone/menaquinone biosynthesis C-methylase UbiE
MSLGTDISILLRTLGVVAARETSSRRFSRVTEKWDTVADDQQWCLAQERYSLAAELGTGKDVLEVGCGTGYGLAKIAPAARSTIGIDADEQNIESARRNAPEVDFRLGLAEKLDLANGCVDVVLALEMVYYVQDRQGLLAEAHRVLRPGGTLLLTLPNGARPGFHPSPFSTSYPDYRSIVQELVELGMGVQVFGSLPLANLDVRSDWMRRLAVAAHLVPRTLEGRSRLKRWLGRRMRPLKLIEPTSNGLLEKLPRIEDATTASRFGIWVVVGTRP